MSGRANGGASPAPDKSSAHAKGGKKLLKEVLELETFKTKDGRIRTTIKPVEETLTFDKGFYVFVRALQMLKAHNDGVILVGLAGPSGSGKTAFSEKIKTFMPGVVVISMDMYNDGSKVVDQNFDDPRLTDYDTLLANLCDLKAGKPTQVPIYDFKVSKRIGYMDTKVPDSRIIIIEGIYALSDRLKPLLDLRVSITGGVHFDLVKRVMRDISRSGQGPDEIIQQITDTVYPMYKAYIEPDLRAAQLQIYNAFNPFSGFMHPTYILKSTHVPDVDVLRRELEHITGGLISENKDVDLYDIYLLPPNEDPETCQSWLRMRNRDGRYSLMFEEWVTEEPFIISPRITFEVGVRILGGLMALGYEIGAMMRRTSLVLRSAGDEMTVKVDDIEGLGRFVQLLGRDRERVRELGARLGLEGTYIARSYIEQVQLGKLTSDFGADVTPEMRDKIAQNNTDVLQEIFSSPPARIPRHQSLSGTGMASGTASLSSSAPANSLAPIFAAASQGELTPGNNAVNNLTSLNAYAVNAGSSGAVAARQQNGLLRQQLQEAAGALSAQAASPVPAKLVSGFATTPVGTPPTHPGAPMHSTHTLHSTQRTAADTLITDYVHAGNSGASLTQAVGKLEAKLATISHSMQGLSHISGLQIQLDAMAEQYRQTNEQLVQLSGATATLAASLRDVVMQQYVQAEPRPVGALWSQLGLAAGAMVLGMAAGVLLINMRQRT